MRAARSGSGVVVIGEAGRVDGLDAAGAAGVSVELFEPTVSAIYIGESLIPETYWVLKRLGMLPKMQQSHFVKKFSVQFVTRAAATGPLYFWDNKPHECRDVAGGRSESIR